MPLFGWDASSRGRRSIWCRPMRFGGRSEGNQNACDNWSRADCCIGLRHSIAKNYKSQGQRFQSLEGTLPENRAEREEATNIKSALGVHQRASAVRYRLIASGHPQGDHRSEDKLSMGPFHEDEIDA